MRIGNRWKKLECAMEIYLIAAAIIIVIIIATAAIMLRRRHAPLPPRLHHLLLFLKKSNKAPSQPSEPQTYLLRLETTHKPSSSRLKTMLKLKFKEPKRKDAEKQPVENRKRIYTTM